MVITRLQYYYDSTSGRTPEECTRVHHTTVCLVSDSLPSSIEVDSWHVCKKYDENELHNTKLFL